LHYILLKTVPKQVQMAVACNKYSLCRMHKQAPFCTKPNLRENRFSAAGGRLVGKMGTHNVKIRTENITRCKFTGWQVARLKRRGAANNIERMGKTPFYYFYTIMFLDERRLARRRKMCLISLYFLVLAAICAARKCVRRKKHQYYLKD